MKSAIILGAAGFIGSSLLRELIGDPEYSQILIIVRKELPIASPKVKQLIADRQTIDRVRSQIAGDELFIAIGTTRAKTPDQAEYAAIDRDYPVHVAKIAKANGVRSVSIVTAVGANPDSKFFYVRTKGEVERELISLGFERTAIFQPSMLLGERKEDRPFEKAMINLWTTINPLIGGPLTRYRGITGDDVAKAMVRAAKIQKDKIARYQWAEMKAVLSDASRF